MAMKKKTTTHKTFIVKEYLKGAAYIRLSSVINSYNFTDTW